MNPRFWLISYDIASPKQLRRAAKTLEGCGERIQKSVFECGLTPDQSKSVRASLLRTSYNKETDKLMFQPICTLCRRGIRWQGMHPPANTEPFWIV